MEITLGNLTAQFITDPVAWKVWAPIGLVAECHPQDWCNEAVDFRSEEAGRVLLAGLQEVYADFTTEGEMVKDDQGTTKDVPDTSPETPAATPEVADTNGDGQVSADEILAFIKELLDACEGASEAQPEIVEAIEELVGLHKQAVECEVEKLLAQAEANAAQGLDVTATLARIEELLAE